MGMLWVISFSIVVATILIVALRRRSRPRTIVWLLALVLLSYLAIVLLPFFAYGMHLQDPVQVAGGSFDPKGYPLFRSGTLMGEALHFVALLIFQCLDTCF